MSVEISQRGRVGANESWEEGSELCDWFNKQSADCTSVGKIGDDIAIDKVQGAVDDSEITTTL